MKHNVILLGPQRDVPTVRRAVSSLGIPDDAQLAAVTAGWEEREPEDLELGEHLGGRVTNLRIHRRADDVYQRDPELLEAMRNRHDRLRGLQEIYRLQLRHALEVARELLERDKEEEIVRAQDAAIEAVRVIDHNHLARVTEIHAEFEHQMRPREREVVAHHCDELEQILAGTAGLCVAGGHVAILLNRMRLFDLMSLLGNQPIIGWSAGAMVLSEKIVLFHDSPPQGAGDAEVLVPGLAVCRGVVPLPHARRRLRLDDRTRVALFARRFRGDLCATLDDNHQIAWDGARWTGGFDARQLTEAGTLVEVEAA